MVWDWQIDAALNGWGWSEDNRPPEYFRKWNREHPEAHARIVAKYRRTHREKTLAQWRADTKRYEARVGHDVIRERNRAAVRRYMARKRAERLALKEAERNLSSVESDGASPDGTRSREREKENGIIRKEKGTAETTGRA